ncbi:MAG: VanZ family protein [Terriglobia bacterium]
MLLWAALITVLSSRDFAPGFTHDILRAVVGFFFPAISDAGLHKINVVIRKLAHVSEYFVLGLVVWRALRRGAAEGWQRRWALGTLAAGVLFAGLDEFHQLFAPGRTASLADVGFDSAGVLLALLLLYAWARRRLP